MLVNELQNMMKQATLVFDHSQINRALVDQSIKLNQYLDSMPEDSEAPIVLAVMNGGLIYAGQLLPLINRPVVVDYIHATRYRNSTMGSELEWKVYPQHELKNRTVIILDDILDEGHTLAAIVKYCQDQAASEVLSLVMVTKLHARREQGIMADFSALDVPDRYVFGYGMDYKGYLRNLDGIYYI